MIPEETTNTSHVIKETEDLTIFKVSKTVKASPTQIKNTKKVLKPSEKTTGDPVDTELLPSDPEDTHESNYCETCSSKHLGDECPVCEKIFKCKICEQKFSGSNSLNLHIAQMHDDSAKIETQRADEIHICSTCKSPFTSLEDLNIHMVEDHEHRRSLSKRRGPSSCAICVTGFTDIRQLNEHKRLHEMGVVEKQCRLCPSAFTTNHDLEVHMKDVHRKEHHACSLCSSTYTSKTRLNDHMKRIHSLSEDFGTACEVCKVKFADEDQKITHMRSHFGNSDARRLRLKDFVESDKRNCKEKALKRQHTVVHEIVEKECAICHSLFATSHELEVHMKDVHHGCDLCSSNFTSKAHLYDHMNKIHGQSENFGIECDVNTTLRGEDVVESDKQKTLKSVINRALKIVKGEGYKNATEQKDFVCPVCSKTFPHNYNHAGHMKTTHHWKSAKIRCLLYGSLKPRRPYICTMCPMTYVRSTHLRQHIERSHSKTQVCHSCQKTCKNQKELEKHLATEHGQFQEVLNEQTTTVKVAECRKERPFTCPQCGSTYLNGSHLKTHLERSHNIGYERKRLRKLEGINFSRINRNSSGDDASFKEQEHNSISLRLRKGRNKFRSNCNSETLAATSYSKENNKELNKNVVTGRNKKPSSREMMSNKEPLEAIVYDELTGNNEEHSKTNGNSMTDVNRESLKTSIEENVTTAHNYQSATRSKRRTRSSSKGRMSTDDYKKWFKTTDFDKELLKTTSSKGVVASNSYKDSSDEEISSIVNEEKLNSKTSTSKRSKRIQPKRTGKTEASYSPYDFKCGLCSLEFSDLSDIDDHLNEHEARGEFDAIHVCESCGRIFDSPDALTDHMLERHTSQLNQKRNNKEKATVNPEATGQILKAMRFQFLGND